MEEKKKEKIDIKEWDKMQRKMSTNYFTYFFAVVLAIFVIFFIFIMVRSAPLIKKANNTESTNSSGIADVSKENIIYEDSYKKYGYVNNRILVYFNDQASKEEIDNVIKSIDATIVGNEDKKYELQISPLDLEQLKELLSDIETMPGVERTNLVRIITLD